MFSQYFGQYLLSKGCLTIEQLKAALEYEKNTKVKLGILAMNAGFMSVDEIEKVHKEQARVDEKFGEIAIAQEYLTSDQLEILLSTQKQGHLVLSQCIVDKGFMTLTQLNTVMEAYISSLSLTMDDLKAFDEGKLLNAYIHFEDTLWHEIYTEYISLLLRNCIRFINDVPVIHIEKVDENYLSDWMVSQRIFGKFSMFTSLASNDTDSLKHLAELFNKESYDSFDEYAQDGVSEFLNLHNGIFLVNISNNGVVLDMVPQKIKNHVKLDELPECFKITLTWLWGSIDMIIY